MIDQAVAHAAAALLPLETVSALDQQRYLGELRGRLDRKVPAAHAVAARTTANAFLLRRLTFFVALDFTVSRAERHAIERRHPNAFRRRVYELNGILRGLVQEGELAPFGYGPLRDYDWRGLMTARANGIFGLLCDEQPGMRHFELEFPMAQLIEEVTRLSHADAVHAIDLAVTKGRNVFKDAIRRARTEVPNDRWAWRDAIDRPLAVEVSYMAFLHRLLSCVRDKLAKEELTDSDPPEGDA